MRGGPEYHDGTDVFPPPSPEVACATLAGLTPRASQAPEVFTVPVEMVLYMTNSTGLMFLRRAREQGATFLRTARVWRVSERLVAEVAYAAPIGAENATGCVVNLSVALWENLA